jgi:hypothetical protein
VRPVGNESRAPKPAAGARPNDPGDPVPGEAENAGERERSEMRRLVGRDEAQDRFVTSNTNGDKNRQDDEEPGDSLSPGATQREGDAERDRGRRIAHVVDEVSKECDAA